MRKTYSKQYQPPSLRHIRMTHEQKRKELQYRDYLIQSRNWTEQEAIAYIQTLRVEDDR